MQSCDSALTFTLVNNQLFANSSTETLQFGTNPGTPLAEFLPSANPGAITDIFYVDAQNNLRWTNGAFFNNQARFCVNNDGKLLAVYDDPSVAPPGCLFVTLTLSKLSGCPNGGAGPSGPSGVRDITSLAPL